MIFAASKLFRSVPLLMYSPSYQTNLCRFSRVACLCGKTPLYTKNAMKRRASKDAVAFKKVFGDNNAKKKRKKWLDDLTGIFPMKSGGNKPSKPSIGTQRRAQQLNVILHDEISRILGCGEVGPELIPLGFHITMVDIALDFSVINIRWEADGSERDSLIEKYLPACAYGLRRALTSYRVMGNVPEVQFVKDLRAFRLKEVNHLLDIADMGPDYVRPELGENLKTPKAVPYKTFKETMSKASFHFTDQDIITQASTTGAMEVVSHTLDTNDQKESKPLPLINDFADLKLSSDAYDVDQAGYSAKVLQLKRQSVRRSGNLGERIAISEMKETPMDKANIKDIKKLLAAKKGKQLGENVRKSKYKDHLSPWTLNVTNEDDFANEWSQNDTHHSYEEPDDFYEEDYDRY